MSTKRIEILRLINEAIDVIEGTSNHSFFGVEDLTKRLREAVESIDKNYLVVPKENVNKILKHEEIIIDDKVIMFSQLDSKSFNIKTELTESLEYLKEKGTEVEYRPRLENASKLRAESYFQEELEYEKSKPETT